MHVIANYIMKRLGSPSVHGLMVGYGCGVVCGHVKDVGLFPFTYRIAENFHKFRGLEPPAKVFSTNIGRAIPTYDRF